MNKQSKFTNKNSSLKTTPNGAFRKFSWFSQRHPLLKKLQY